MRTKDEVLIDLIKLNGEIQGKGVIGDIQTTRDVFTELKDEVKSLFPDASLFNKKIYFGDSFDYKLPQMQEECIEMILLF
jgi:hypothetical protein